VGRSSSSEAGEAVGLRGPLAEEVRGDHHHQVHGGRIENRANASGRENAHTGADDEAHDDRPHPCGEVAGAIFDVRHDLAKLEEGTEVALDRVVHDGGVVQDRDGDAIHDGDQEEQAHAAAEQAAAAVAIANGHADDSWNDHYCAENDNRQEIDATGQ
jgi:hypothetical protein